MDDVLVILDSTGAARDEIARRGSVSHQISERVLVLRGDAAGLGRLPGVERVYTGAEQQFDLPQDLSPAESVFAKGWMEKGKKSGPRPGEGRDWDSPGFLPPDPPKRD